jgi:Ca-activated chloride channel family protein
MKRFFSLLLPLLLAALALQSCGVSVNSPLGATVGGAQDIGYARQIIESGGIPEADYIVSEGLFSEHDIEAPEGECGGKLCTALGYGYAPAIDDGKEGLFVHLGLTSSIRQEEFHRPHLQLALVIDRSGSMQGASMDAVKEALRRLVEKLSPDDEVMLVAFNNEARTLYGPKMLTDKGTLLGAINGMNADNGTDIEAGLKLGYEGLSRLATREGYSRRVILFTDAMPNIGATDPNSFEGMTAYYADRGIGLTAFGVGVDFGQELTHHITRLRGGNFFFLQNSEKIRSVFDNEFDFLVTSIVYDLKVVVTPPDGLRLRDVYGLPSWQPGSTSVTLEAPTVFLSSNRGAIILRFERTDGAPLTIAPGDLLARGTLDYTDVDGTHISRALELRHEGPSLAAGTLHYSGNGTRLAVALSNIYLALRGSCAHYRSGDRPGALEILQRARTQATLDDAALNDAGLRREIALLEKLAKNMGG